MKQKVNFVLRLLFGLLLINAGLNKFLNYMPLPNDISGEVLSAWSAFEQIGWLMPLVGLSEVVGGIFFIVPRTKALGALIVFPVMLGIVISNFSISPEGLPMAIVLFAINLWVIIDNKNKFLPLIKSN